MMIAIAMMKTMTMMMMTTTPTMMMMTITQYPQSLLDNVSFALCMEIIFKCYPFDYNFTPM